MLLVTTDFPYKFYWVISTDPLQERVVTLPIGSHLFRDIPNPINPAMKPWVALVEPNQTLPELPADACVGMCKEALLFHSRPTFGGFRDLFVQVEEVADVATLLSVTTPVSITPTQEESYSVPETIPLLVAQRAYTPPFARTRYYPKRLAPIYHVPLRRRWRHPAARRVA